MNRLISAHQDVLGGVRMGNVVLSLDFKTSLSVH